MPQAPHPAPIDVLTRPIWFAPILLVLASSLSYVYADRAMPVPDEGALLTAAVKILNGGVFYRDIDAYAFPGASYLLAWAMSIFGEHLWVARALAGSFFCTIVLGTYACALMLMDRKRAALCGLALLPLKFIAFPIFTMFFYADPSLAAAIMALALFLRHPFKGPSIRLFGVGVFTGLAIVTKQPTGIYIAIVFAIVLCFPAFAHGPKKRPYRPSEVLVYGSGMFVVVGSMSAYFAIHGVFGNMVQGGLLRPFTSYLPTGGVSFLPPLEWWNLGELKTRWPVYLPQRYVELVIGWTQPGESIRNFYLGIGELVSRISYSAIPIVYVTSGWIWIRAFGTSPTSNRSENDNQEDPALARSRFFSGAGVTLAITLSAFPRADFTHIMTIYPAVILIIFALRRPSKIGHREDPSSQSETGQNARRSRFEAAFVAVALFTTTFLSARYDATLTHRLSIERADLWVKPRDAWLEGLVETIQTEIPRDEPFFVYGHEAQWYFLSDRYAPRPFSQLYPGMTGDSTGEELATMIRESRPRLVAQGVIRWPGTPALPSYTQELERTLNSLYRSDPLAVRSPPRAGVLRILKLRE